MLPSQQSTKNTQYQAQSINQSDSGQGGGYINYAADSNLLYSQPSQPSYSSYSNQGGSFNYPETAINSEKSGYGQAYSRDNYYEATTYSQPSPYSDTYSQGEDVKFLMVFEENKHCFNYYSFYSIFFFFSSLFQF